MLELSDIVVRYGPFLAVDRLSLRVDDGEIVGLVGPNGAGKSSLVKVIGGSVVPAAGRVTFRGEDLAALPTHARVARGISIVPEGRGLFPNMSVEENLLMGGYPLARGAAVALNVERSFALFPILAERRRQAAGTLSGGQQQMLALCVGLMSDPKLLVLDEPSLGLAPIVVAEIGRTLRTLRERHLTVLLIEQNARLTCSVADRIYILDAGRVQHHDAADRILANPAVVDHLV
ncbi:MAG TPA: ABC transporter ATP-binding protein [Xanthobacteraceae bacterium]|nr:ABC transporter ATP-binding protein [Xanthobacteraceae bacterium]